MRGARGEGRSTAGARWIAGAFLLALCVPRPSLLAGQAPGTYTDHAVTTVVVESAGAEVIRTILRDGRYVATLRDDTLVVQAVELELRSTTSGETVRHDTDGFVGGRWKLLARDGNWRTVERPFVPAALQDVTDLAALMDDFFPPPPPVGLPVGSRRTGHDGRVWERLPGDGRHAVHGWTLERSADSSRIVADSLVAVVREQLSERGEGAWAGDGIASWSRTIEIDSKTELAGRVIHARIRRQLEVTRSS